MTTAFTTTLPLYRRPRRTFLPHAVNPRSPIHTMSSAGQQLRTRIQTVRSAEKIVSALRLVSAARIRSSSAAALRARPFANHVQVMLSSLLQHVQSRNIDIKSLAHDTPMYDVPTTTLHDPAVSKAFLDRMHLALMCKPLLHEAVLIVVVTSDKRFCGPYNRHIIAHAVHRMRQLKKMNHVVELVIIGRTAMQFFQTHHQNVPIRYFAPLGKASEALITSSNLNNMLLSHFIAGGIERVEVVYTRFVSLLASTPSSRTLLPVTPTGVETIGDEIFQLTSQNGRLSTKPAPRSESIGFTPPSMYKISDQEALLVLNAMIPMYVTSQIQRIVRESIASEQSSRLAAMQAATDNARDVIARLQSTYNKQRQARITNEIIEVVSHTNM